MKNYDDKLYIGNIMQSDIYENNTMNPNINCWTIKEDAVLYRTHNDGFVDIDELNLNSFFISKRIKLIEKVEIDKTEKETKNGLTVMPVIFPDEIKKAPNDIAKKYVDGTSLVSFIDYINGPFMSDEIHNPKIKIKEI